MKMNDVKLLNRYSVTTPAVCLASPATFRRFNAATSRNAFTLIELILASGVSAIVLIAINAVFFSALRLRNSTQETVEEATPIENAIIMMRRYLMCAVGPIPGGIMTGNFKAGDVSSVGIPDMVNLEVFTATGALSADPASPWGDIQRVTYG